MAINKASGGVEDVNFGMGTRLQLRKGQEVVITDINASHIPYDETDSVKSIIDSILTINVSNAVWGGITGALSNQTDLQAALDAKEDVGAGTATWGGIAGTLTNQIDLRDALNLKADKSYVDTENANQDAAIDAKLPVLNPAYTGTLTGVDMDITGDATANRFFGSVIQIDGSSITVPATDELFIQAPGVGSTTIHLRDGTKKLDLTATDMLWGTIPVVVGNASETNVGGIKILVSGSDCYITTDGSTPGP